MPLNRPAMRTTAIRLPIELLAKFDEVGRQRRVSRCELMRLAAEKYLVELEKESHAS